jgi:ribosomal protein S18 acetylase RimI-like enzyme
LRDWQTAYDAEGFIVDYLGVDDFYEKYGITNLDTRKVLLQVGMREGVDRRGREATGGGTRETAIALLTRANAALGIKYVEDFRDKEGHDKKRRRIKRARYMARERREAKNRVIFTQGAIKIVSDPFHYPTRDVWERGVVKEGEVEVGKFELDIPYRSKALTKFVQTQTVDFPAQVIIDWFEIFSKFRGKGLGRKCYEALEGSIRERYDPDEIGLKTAVWDVKRYWEKMGYALIGHYLGQDTRNSMVKKFRRQG